MRSHEPTAISIASSFCLPADISGASGLARLIPPSSPFGLAVSPAGEQLYDIEFTIKDLPDAASLGRYSAFVAWATTPQLHPVIRLGRSASGHQPARARAI